jgi:hypothetical protein
MTHRPPHGAPRPPGPAHRLARLLLLLTGLVAVSACSDLAADSPLAHARKSPELLAGAALRAIAASDAEALELLRVTRDEFEDLIWPVLPDREQMPFNFAWGMTQPRSRKARRTVMDDFGGVDLQLLSVDLGDDVEMYPGVTLYREARMRVRRADTGEEGLFPLMDTVVRIGDGWKFVNFADDV